MKFFRLSLALALVLALVLTSAVFADDGVTPLTIPATGGFTLSPNSGYAEDIVTFTLNFDVANADIDSPNVICVYYPTGEFNNVVTGDLTSVLGDTYTADWDGTTNCPDTAGFSEWKFSVANPTDDAEYGDTLTFDFAIPVGYAAGTKSFRARQDNTDPAAAPFVSGRNASLTVYALDDVAYVANDIASCGGNTPCLTGPHALPQAVNGVTAVVSNVYVMGSYNLAGDATVYYSGMNTVNLIGATGASINNLGHCSGDMISLMGYGWFQVKNLSINGACSSGSRSAGFFVSDAHLNVENTIIKNFTSSPAVIADSDDSYLSFSGNTFINNLQAFELNSGNNDIFANSVLSNLSTNAVVASGGTNKMPCNYWNDYEISGTGLADDFDLRLGSTPVSYEIESGILHLGNLTVNAGGGVAVLVDMGRDNAPFKNGTTAGLGAMVSNFYAVCAVDGGPFVVRITTDPVDPGVRGFRGYTITDPAQCSPSTNGACWDYASVTSAAAGPTDLVFPAGSGHFMVGNEVDPTMVAVSSLTASTASALPFAILASALVLGLAGLLIARKRS